MLTQVVAGVSPPAGSVQWTIVAVLIMDSLARDKAEFLQVICGYASALCHCTLVLISSVKLLQMNLLLLLPLGWISRRLSRSEEERCGTALNMVSSNLAALERPQQQS